MNISPSFKGLLTVVGKGTKVTGIEEDLAMLNKVNGIKPESLDSKKSYDSNFATSLNLRSGDIVSFSPDSLTYESKKNKTIHTVQTNEKPKDDEELFDRMQVNGFVGNIIGKLEDLKYTIKPKK